MTPLERWLLWTSTVLTTVTGTVYLWTKYFVESADPWAVINHPWQPLARKAHRVADDHIHHRCIKIIPGQPRQVLCAVVAHLGGDGRQLLLAGVGVRSRLHRSHHRLDHPVRF